MAKRPSTSFPFDETEAVMVLHVYHAAIDEKEFDFTLDIGPPEAGGLDSTLLTALREASPAMLEEVQPILCCACRAKNATQLLHHPMLFDQVIPPRIEDIPLPVCNSPECHSAAKAQMEETLKEAHGYGPSCLFCRSHHGRLMRCSRCKVALYCSPECQKSHWPLHKKICAEVSHS
jgi:hypothetical protein